MKVLQVIDRLNIGGAERVMINVTQLLVNRDVEVGVLLFNAGYPLDEYIDEKAVVFILDRENKYSISKLYKAHNICSKYEIVHAHMRHCYSYIKLAQLLFGGKYKLILHDHYGDINIDKTVPFRLSSVFKPKYYIGVSHTLTEWAKDILKVNCGNIYTLPNTIVPDNTVQYQPDNARKRVLIVSNIRATKNIEFAISLVRKLGWQCTIFGNNADDAYYEKILSLVKEDKDIELVSGQTNLAQLYNNYSIAIHCGISETGPLVLLEYLAFGIPFIAYKTGEVAEVISMDLPLNFMDSFNVDQWIARIHDIQTQEDLSFKLKSVFKQHFDPEKYTDKCLEIYRSISC